MLKIIQSDTSHIPAIQQVASLAWPDAFKEILSASQIAYMMQWMYSDESLREQMEKKGHRFFWATSNEKPVGYMSIEHHCEGTNKTKIHKIYLLPDVQRQGIGRMFLEMAQATAKEQRDTVLYLNVNKYNQRAIDFYRKTGFQLVKEEVIDIGNGFVMDDFVFELPLNSQKGNFIK